jgi:glutathionyl-hydroquinone reductase
MNNEHPNFGPPQKYDWEKWFSKDRFDLIRHEHFKCDARVMAQQVRNAAMVYTQDGKPIRVSIQVDDRAQILYVKVST